MVFFTQIKRKNNIFICNNFMYLYFAFLGLYQFGIKANMKEYIYNANKDVLNSVEKNITDSFQDSSTVSKWIMNSKEILAYLNTDDENNSEIIYDALTSIYAFVTTENDLSSVYIFRNDGNYISINNGVTYVDKNQMDEDWYEEIEDANGGYVIKINGGGIFRQSSDKPLVSLICAT